MTIKEAKEMDLVDYLSKLGHKPASIKGPEHWYFSPLHEEKDPSFSVNRKLNQWYDFSIGKGGNLVDFGIQYHRCSISELLQKLSSPRTDVEKHLAHAQQMKDTEKKPIEILSTHLISSYPLSRYLRSRRIKEDIANRYCQEVRYKSNDKIYYALGFKNDSGGYELRNEKYKGGNSPKDVTSILNGAKDLAVFEGFFDFLSYQTLNANQDVPDRNFLILNSTAFFEKNLPFMQEHRHVHLYLDTDKTGEKYTLQALTLDKDKFKDERRLYHPYKDLNDWLMHFGQIQRQRLQQKP
jgi:DNA primase